MSDRKDMTRNNTSETKYSVTHQGVDYFFEMKEQNEQTMKFAAYRYSDLLFFVVLSHNSDEDALEQLESVLIDYLDEYCGFIR